jgi:PKD repeat protein
MLGACGITAVASAQTRTIRVVTYNIQADVTINGVGITNPLAGLIAPFSGTGTFTQNSSGTVTNGGVIEGIGEEILAGNYQPIDILALQETTNNAVGVQPIVDGLNAFYSSRSINAGYAMSPYQATSTGGDGGGPNALVYNTNTLQLIGSFPIGTPSSSGAPRVPMRYQFAPAGVATNASNLFWVYNSHYKSATDTSSLARRGVEAGIIRSNSASLPTGSRVLYVGDYNVSTSTETSYQAIVGNTICPIGIQGIDPFNLSGATGIDWTQNSLLSNKTESCRSLHYRDDFQIMSSNVYYGVTNGLAYVPGTYHTFGNNGTIPYNNNTINAANNSLSGKLQSSPPISAAQCYTNLYGASDHLPVVADYTIPVPAPVVSFTGNPTNGTAPLTVSFTDNSTGAITSNFWSFGDGGTTNFTAPTNVTHTYGTSGVYTVTLTATGSGISVTNTQANLITVLDLFQAWQLQYFGCTNCSQALAGADPLGKGMSNTNQFLVGLNPTNPASLFQITSVTQVTTNVLVTWMMGSGKTNALQRTAGTGGSYSTNNFTDIFIVTNTVGTITNYLDRSAATNFPARYYRVRLVP